MFKRICIVWSLCLVLFAAGLIGASAGRDPEVQASMTRLDATTHQLELQIGRMLFGTTKIR